MKIIDIIKKPFTQIMIVVFCFSYVAGFFLTPFFISSNGVYAMFACFWIGLITLALLIGKLWRCTIDSGDGETINKRKLMP